MQINLKILLIGASVPLVMMLSSCASSFIEVRKGSDRVSVADADQVGQCKYLGNTTVSVLAKIGFVSRSIDAVNANLLQLARNSAVDLGGDTLVPGARPEVGRRVFAIYKCRP